MKSPCRSLSKIAASFSFAASLLAQPGPVARAWRLSHQDEILHEYLELLKIPNHSSDKLNIRRNAEAIRAMFAKRGVQMKLLEIGDLPPVVFGEIPSPGAVKTIVLYAHYDGQPVDPSQWTVTAPFTPLIKDGRIWARSSSDDKAPIQAIATALDALHAAGLRSRSNIKLFFEGEEEAGSPHIREFLEKYKTLLNADAWIFCDGPVHPSRREQIAFGTRGVVGFEVTVYGPRQELHSGHYGNWAPNPALLLAQLIASMRGDDGRVKVEDFYKGAVPLSPSERVAVDTIPDVTSALKKEMWLGANYGAERLEILVNEPVLNVRGLRSAAVGAEARNVVPSTATGSFDIRLVKGISPAAMIERVKAHLRAQGYFLTEGEPSAEERLGHAKVARFTHDAGYSAVRASMDLPIARDVIAAVEAARGPVLHLPTLGGSLPMSVFEEVLHRPLLIVPIVNHDNNQHTHNENLRLENLWNGIETMAALLSLQ